MLLRDLLLVAENARYIPRLFASSAMTNDAFRVSHSEVNYAQETVTATKLIRALVAGQGIKTPRGAEILTVGGERNKSEKWFFVNGIGTDKDLAIKNARSLS